MPSITKRLTEQATSSWEAHPLYVYWSGVLMRSQGSSLRIRLYRPREGLTYAPAKLYVFEVRRDGREDAPQEYLWDTVANTGLIRLGARSVERSDESMRFALMAQELFLQIERRVGDGYFNSVLLEQLRGLEDLPKLTAMLAKVKREYRANPGKAYDECQKQIENVLAELATDLTDSGRLGYATDIADEILDGALAQYVDERFNVKNRELLKW